MSEKEQCPYCGNEYKRLSIHLRFCKEKTVEETTTSYVEDLVEITSTVDTVEEPLIEAQTTPCPYLFIIAGNSCANCRGNSCMASSDKKISNEDYCKYEWLDCIQYEEAKDAGVRAVCPYLGFTIPEGRSACCGLWCHARDSGVRVAKVFISWSNCGRYLEAK